MTEPDVSRSLAAVHVMEALRERGFQGAITMVGAEELPPYDRPPLSKEALRHGIEPDMLVAAGDVASWYNPLFDETMRVEQWNNAVVQGRHAAGTLLGSRGCCVSVPYFWSDQFDAKVRFAGRASAVTETRVIDSSQNRLVVLFGRDNRIRGALCGNAPRQLALYRRAIEDQLAWADVP